MSADYWGSTQRNVWQMNKHTLIESRRKLLLLEKKMIQNGFIKDHSYVVYDSNMRIYLHNLLIRLGRRLNVRQIALATAEVYLSRFLIKVSLKEVNAYLLVAACLYISCKTEECPQHIRLILSGARNLWPEYIPQDITKLAEFEFYIIEELDSYLLLYHPYNSLIQIQEFLNSNVDKYNFILGEDDLQNAWSLVNDSYITDLHLYAPPHIIALAAIYASLVLKKNVILEGNGSSISQDKGVHQMSSCSFDKQEDSKMHIDDLMLLVSGNDELATGFGSENINNTLDSSAYGYSKADQDSIKIDKFINFLTSSHVNLDQISEALQEIIDLYLSWGKYNESIVKKALQLMLLNR